MKDDSRTTILVLGAFIASLAIIMKFPGDGLIALMGLLLLAIIIYIWRGTKK